MSYDRKNGPMARRTKIGGPSADPLDRPMPRRSAKRPAAKPTAQRRMLGTFDKVMEQAGKDAERRLEDEHYAAVKAANKAFNAATKEAYGEYEAETMAANAKLRAAQELRDRKVQAARRKFDRAAKPHRKAQDAAIAAANEEIERKLAELDAAHGS